MPKYLLQVNYTHEGIRGVLKDGGSKRREVATKAVQSVGGKVEAFYFAFGDRDVFVISDMPDHAAAAAVALKVTADGGARVNTTVLLTPEEIDKATSEQVTYTPPGD